jgi:hypothetical protein
MKPAIDLRQHLTLVKNRPAEPTAPSEPVSRVRLAEILEMPARTSDAFTAALPFAPGDTTAGVENELQTVVFGDQAKVDLPLVIRHSNYFKNITAKTRTGDTSPAVLHELENLLDSNEAGVWENSWVRLPVNRLNAYAREVFERDLLADKRRRNGPLRCDADTFFVDETGETRLRLPISYLLKLAVADTIGAAAVHPLVRSSGERVMACFLNDNTSPETHSFYLSRDRTGCSAGQAAAGETLLRYLFSHLLLEYGNQKFGLMDSGQRAALYFAPHPHVRQDRLNQRISDAFYRDLFMSPCLSGWDCGEDKHRYMALCHRVLSRSQLNAVAKLKEAGIITRNLVVLPNTSNISLANNGTHLSIGSRKLSALTAQGAANAGEKGLKEVDEKYYGDLAIKIIEHFLPLFVGTYTAAPYRLDFTDFHPEKVLGFLPHELAATHLRMIWRRWKKKAALNFLGRPLTPFGPQWLDRQIGRLLQLKGDFVYDFRLIDYLVALQSTGQSPALDGCLGNDLRLKRDLAALGVFDETMPLYCLYRLRRQAEIGFNGFEGRYYSLFYDLRTDMARAADLQVLISALAYKYILTGQLRHADIPDQPMVESERRQIFFGAAIGIPTFFVHQRTPNKLMAAILQQTKKTRSSSRYSGFTRVHNEAYRLALLKLLRRDAQDLIDMLGLEPLLVDLENRLTRPHTYAAAHRLTAEILAECGARHPLDLKAAEFNQAAEAYYRTTLKKRQLGAAFAHLEASVGELDHWGIWREGYYNQALMTLLKGQSASGFVGRVREDALKGSLPTPMVHKLLQLMLLLFHQKHKTAEPAGE